MKLTPVGANQTSIEINNDLIVFFSYKTAVACQKLNETTGRFEYFKTDKLWSHTTSRHINNWLGNMDVKIKEQSWFDNLIK